MNIQKRREGCNTIKDVVLANTGLTEKEFFETEKEYFIKGMKEASEIIKTAAKQRIPITVVGDYDADGICASAILSILFDELGIHYTIRLPKRFSEGYGLSEEIIDEIHEGILLTVDNGIAADNAVKKAKEKGLTVLIIDHHLPDAENTIPKADIVIDPNAIPNTADFNEYCGAGLAYKLSEEVLGKDHPLIPKLISFAFVATIADVVPLVFDNRNIVKNGLNFILCKDGRTKGLGALLNKFDLTKYISVKDVGFKIAPAINAPGRMQDDGADFAFQAITSDKDDTVALEMANTLHEINGERKTVKTETVDIINSYIKENNMQNDCPLIVYMEGLAEGLLGLFAGSVAEHYKKPCIVLTDTDEEGIIKGSGRTYGDINLKDLLDKNKDLLIKYGGHKEAVGISKMPIENLDEFIRGMKEELKHTPAITDDTIYYDMEIKSNEIGRIFEELKKFEPFGKGNPEIVFLIRNFDISYVRYMQNDQSVKLVGGYATAACFDMGDEYRKMGEPKTVDLIGTLCKNNFMNRLTNQVDVIKIIPKEKINQLTPMAQKLADMARKNSVNY